MLCGRSLISVLTEGSGCKDEWGRMRLVVTIVIHNVIRIVLFLL